MFKKKKKNLDGDVERLRVRLMAKDFAQILGLDFFGTYAPVARLGTVHIVYAPARMMLMPLASLDVGAGFNVLR